MKKIETAAAASSAPLAKAKIRRRRQELEFLPAALEVLETPASPAGRAISLLIALLVVLILIWGYWGQMDMVAVAQGKLIAGGHVKLIQPLGLGVVRAIQVSEGQRVQAGQFLIELDSTESEVDREQIQQAINAAQMESRRLEVTWLRLNAEAAELDYLSETDPLSHQNQQLLQNHKQKLEADLDEYHAWHAALESEALQIGAERRAHLAQTIKLESLLPIVEEQEQAFRTLLERKAGLEPISGKLDDAGKLIWAVVSHVGGRVFHAFV